MQQNLFQIPEAQTPQIAGLKYIPEFIDAATEASLIAKIDTEPWITDLKRRVQHYGWRYDYKARTVTPDLRIGELPDWLQTYAHQLHQQGLFSEMPDQVIINEYGAGQGIAPHIDCVPCFGKTIASLSLGSACVMDFSHSKTLEKDSMLLEPRSLLVLTEDARYVWQHGIAGRKTDKINGTTIYRTRRISMTFRKVVLG
jgi:alkylated DNA repair dioxygenase AlkB